MVFLQEEEAYNDENMMASSSSEELQVLASSPSASYSSSSDDAQEIIISSHPLFKEIGNLIQSYRSISPSNSSNNRLSVIMDKEEGKEEEKSMAHIVEIISQPPFVSTTTPTYAMPSAPISEKTQSDCIGLGYISSASTEEDMYPSTSYMTVPSGESITSMSCHSSSPLVSEGSSSTTNKYMQQEGAQNNSHSTEPKFDTLVLHVSSRNSEVISATTALFKSPRAAAYHPKSSKAALFISPRNHLSTPHDETNSRVTPATATIFTFDDINTGEETNDDEIQAKGSSDISPTSSGTTTTTENSEEKKGRLLNPFQSLLSRIIHQENGQQPHGSTDKEDHSQPLFNKLPVTFLQQEEFQKDVNDFTKRLKEIKENVRCDVYLVEGQHHQGKKNNTKLVEEGENNEELLQQQEDEEATRHHKEEEVLYVFSVTEPGQPKNQRNNPTDKYKDEKSMEDEKKEMLRTQCEKHVHPELLDHIKKYGNFELFKILPPPPPPPCTPPAMKQKQQHSGNYLNHAPNPNGKSTKSVNNFKISPARSVSDGKVKGYRDMEVFETDSICDMFRYKLEELSTSDAVISENCALLGSCTEAEKEGFVVNRPQSTAFGVNLDNRESRRYDQTQRLEVTRISHDVSIREDKEKEHNISPLILRERRGDNQTLDAPAFKSNLNTSRRTRIAALKMKNTLRKGEESLDLHNAENEDDDESGLQCSSEVSTSHEEMPLVTKFPKSNIDSTRRARISALKKKTTSRAEENNSQLNVAEHDEEKEETLKKEISEEAMFRESPPHTNAHFTRRARVMELIKKNGFRHGGENFQSYEAGKNESKINEPLQNYTGATNIERAMMKEPLSESNDLNSMKAARVSALKKKSNLIGKPDYVDLHSNKNEEKVHVDFQEPETSQKKNLIREESSLKSNNPLSRKAKISDLMEKKKMTRSGGLLPSVEKMRTSVSEDEIQSASHREEIKEEAQLQGSAHLSNAHFNRKARILELKNKKKMVARLSDHSNETKVLVASMDEEMKKIVCEEQDGIEERKTRGMPAPPNPLTNRRYARVLELKKKKTVSRTEGPTNSYKESEREDPIPKFFNTH
jgi:hypothetical protein